jgi:hypothetical protein
MSFQLGPLCFYLTSRISLVIEFDEDWCMDLIGVFPGVVAFRVTLPFDQILQSFLMSPCSMGTDLLHFIFLFSINQIRGRSCEVWFMGWCFSVWHQETSVKHRMDAPLSQQFEAYSYW